MHLHIIVLVCRLSSARSDSYIFHTGVALPAASAGSGNLLAATITKTTAHC